MKSGFSDTIPNGSGERKAVKGVEVALHSGCIRVICFSGINMTFDIVTDFFKEAMQMLVVAVFRMLSSYLNASLIIQASGELTLLRLYSKFVHCLANWLRNTVQHHATKVAGFW